MNKYNFSAGPARLHPSVIKKANDSIINYQDSGMSILEISHRSKEYKEIMEKLDKKEPLEIVRSGSSGISSNLKTLTI